MVMQLLPAEVEPTAEQLEPQARQMPEAERLPKLFWAVLAAVTANLCLLVVLQIVCWSKIQPMTGDRYAAWSDEEENTSFAKESPVSSLIVTAAAKPAARTVNKVVPVLVAVEMPQQTMPRASEMQLDLPVRSERNLILPRRSERLADVPSYTQVSLPLPRRSEPSAAAAAEGATQVTSPRPATSRAVGYLGTSQILRP